MDGLSARRPVAEPLGGVLPRHGRTDLGDVDPGPAARGSAGPSREGARPRRTDESAGPGHAPAPAGRTRDRVPGSASDRPRLDLGGPRPSPLCRGPRGRWGQPAAVTARGGGAPSRSPASPGHHGGADAASRARTEERPRHRAGPRRAGPVAHGRGLSAGVAAAASAPRGGIPRASGESPDPLELRGDGPRGPGLGRTAAVPRVRRRPAPYGSGSVAAGSGAQARS